MATSGWRLKTGANKLKNMASVIRAEFFALPACSFDQRDEYEVDLRATRVLLAPPRLTP